MRLTNRGAQIFVPDGAAESAALVRTTHMAVGAHQDDIPIMAFDGVLQAFDRNDRWLLGVTVTDGAGSARTGPYANVSGQDLRVIRAAEEKEAAAVGQYTAVLLDHSSSTVKNPDDGAVVADLEALLKESRPSVVYTHNLADKHDTHVAVALRTIEAIRRIPRDMRPASVYGCEVWRDLDWLIDGDKITFDVTSRPDLAAAILKVYDSQIAGGKRYDAATIGRRASHATFADTHDPDTTQSTIFAMDLTPLVVDVSLDPEAFVAGHTMRLQEEVTSRIRKLSRRRVGSKTE